MDGGQSKLVKNGQAVTTRYTSQQTIRQRWHSSACMRTFVKKVEKERKEGAFGPEGRGRKMERVEIAARHSGGRRSTEREDGTDPSVTGDLVRMSYDTSRHDGTNIED